MVGNDDFHVLCLDGGGSLGAYTLGVLHEVNAILKKASCKSLSETFDLVYGTSTGAIIGSMIALGNPIEEIWRRYQELAPEVMGRHCARHRSKALRDHADRIYEGRTFDCFRTRVGIVSTDIESNAPMIFKSHEDQLRTGVATFEPGFGCTISEAVQASCAAYPFFKRASVDVPGYGGERTLVDGGFLANNPMPLAIIEALYFLRIPKERIRVLSIGTGSFPRRMGPFLWMAYHFLPLARTLFELLDTSTKSMEWINDILFKEIDSHRISGTYTDLHTSFLEDNSSRLQQVYSRGRQEGQEAECRVMELLVH